MALVIVRKQLVCIIFIRRPSEKKRPMRVPETQVRMVEGTDRQKEKGVVWAGCVRRVRSKCWP